MSHFFEDILLVCTWINEILDRERYDCKVRARVPEGQANKVLHPDPNGPVTAVLKIGACTWISVCVQSHQSEVLLLACYISFSGFRGAVT